MFINTRPTTFPLMVVAQTTPPSNPIPGMIWIDTANDCAQYFRNGTSWISDSYQVSTGSYESSVTNGNKSLALSPFITAVGRNYVIDLLDFAVNTQVLAPNNATNFWSYQLRTRPGSVMPGRLDPTEVITSGIVWRCFTLNLRGTTLASNEFLSMLLSYGGNPGYTIFNASVSYRIRLL